MLEQWNDGKEGEGDGLARAFLLPEPIIPAFQCSIIPFLHSMIETADNDLPPGGGAPSGGGRAVVVVNDDPTQLVLLSGLLRQAGLEPAVFSGAEEALRAMDPARPPVLIVTDLYMPGLDGWQFCRLLRSSDYPAFNEVPIVVVSATFAGDEPEGIAADLGAEAFLAAPVDGRVFVERVHAVLRGELTPAPQRVLIVEPCPDLGAELAGAFAAAGYRADIASTVREAAESFGVKACDVAVLNHHLPDGAGDTLLDLFHSRRPDCVCIMVTAGPEPGRALDWMKRGAAAYLRQPFEPEYLLELCARARRERALLRTQDLLELRTRELRESEERFRRLLETVPSVAIQGYNAEGVVRYWNPASERLYGYSSGEVLGRNLLDLTIPDALRTEVRDNLRWMMETGQALPPSERTLRRKGGVFVTVYSSHAVIRLPGQEPELYGFDLDLTERKQAEKERERLQAQLLHAQKMESIGRLAGGVAHDFNNMLGAILGTTELALEQVDGESQLAADLREIRNAAEHSAGLTRQLLAFARKQAVTPRALDLNRTVADMLNVLRRIIGEDVELIWRPGPDVGLVWMDPTQLNQILANLCVNARDAVVSQGVIAIETDRVPVSADECALQADTRPGTYARLTVRDNGCGMTSDTLSHLFEPFFTTKEAGKGTGLGLATVYGIVQQGGGYIRVHSQPGLGTTFRIHLPLHMATAADPIPDSPPTISPATQGGNETILLVDDEPTILTVTRRMLERQGYTILAADTPDGAIRCAREHAGGIHLLMSDMVMPGMSGQELARSLAVLNPKLRFVFMSGYPADVLSGDGPVVAGARFLMKPFSRETLLATVRGGLDGRPEGGQS